MTTRKRLIQSIWVVAIAATAHYGGLLDTAQAAQQPQWCYLCTNTGCSEDNRNELLGVCEQLCDGGEISFHCETGTCEGRGGGTYSSQLRCLRDIP